MVVRTMKVKTEYLSHGEVRMMIKADTAIGRISDILREASLDEDVKLAKIYEIIDRVVENDVVKTAFAELRDNQRLFELCGGANGFGVLIQITTYNREVHHRDLVRRATGMLESKQQGIFYERIGDVKWQRVPGGNYDFTRRT
jgi:hypothetical protein